MAKNKKSSVNNKKGFGGIGVIILFVVIVGLLTSLSFLSKKTDEQGKESLNQNIDISKEVKSFDEEGADHVEGKVDYKTSPPTSGDHSAAPAGYGFYESLVPFENLVHSLEHGDIVIYYNSSAREEDLNALKELSTLTYEGSGVIVVPSNEIKTPIVLTAWTKIMELESFDDKKIKQFIYEYIYEGPEKL